jgi:GcrA cell cycle regulator
MPVSAWTAEADATLRSLVRDGDLKCRQIAQVINKVHGTSFSKNAIIGRMNRLGLVTRAGEQRVTRVHRSDPGRRKASPRPRRVRTAPVEVDQIVAPVPLQPDQPEPGTWKLIELGESQCRWPFGDGPITFCGCAVESETTSYCADHRALGTRPAFLSQAD